MPELNSQKMYELMINSNPNVVLVYSDACNEDNLAQYARYGAARLSYSAIENCYHFGIFPDGDACDSWIRRGADEGVKPFYMKWEVNWLTRSSTNIQRAGFRTASSWTNRHGVCFVQVARESIQLRSSIRAASATDLTWYTTVLDKNPNIQLDTWYTFELFLTWNKAYFFIDGEYYGSHSIPNYDYVTNTTLSSFRQTYIGHIGASGGNRFRIRNILVLGVKDVID